MPSVIRNIRSFLRNSNAYLREAKEAEPGKSQPIRARYARQFLADVGMTCTGPSPEEIAKNGPCIYVANHTSTLDAVIIVSYFEGDLRILAKESLFKIPNLGAILRLEKHIMVHRGKHASEKNASIRESIRQAISEGASVFIFPEGTRTRTGAIGKFRHGAFYNAIQTGVPVVPVVIKGLFEAMPKGTLKIIPGPCSLELLPPIAPPDASLGDESKRARILCDQASEAIRKALENHQGAEK
ncbi:MAG: 1-acyl-sn-glycerol-3-phosphate acyltransferase [Proteobacteria bacterium]|nr:1-acyl-sn-glycerol-3-phosphate acyltransferase [Pseudomonadota bacterium]